MPNDYPDDGLIDAWLLDGRGYGRQLEWSEVVDCQPDEEAWLWIHLDFTFPNVQQWMREDSGLSELTVEAMLQEETRPRCVSLDDGLMIFLRGVNLNPGADPEDMVGIRIWASKNRIISLRKRRLLSVDDIVQSIERGHGPKTPGEFLVTLVDRLLDRVGIFIDQLYDEVDVLEDTILAQSNNNQREQLAEVRRQAIALRRFLAPQRDAMNRLSTERSNLLNDDNRLFISEDSDRLTRIIEELDAARERAEVAQESLISRLAEQTNQRMYLLSIIAAIFLPLSFVTGLLGVNVGGIPGTDNSFGFLWVILLMVFLAGGLWAFLRWRGWF